MAAEAALTVRRVPRGLSSNIEIIGNGSSAATVYCPRDHQDGGPYALQPAAARRALPFQLQGATASHETYYVLNTEGGTIEFSEKIRAITLEGCKKTSFVLAGGCVTSVQMIRCKQCVIKINNHPIGSLKLDDCDGIHAFLGYEAALGYKDDGSIDDRHLGLGIFHSACHAVEIHSPVGPEADSPMVAQTLPEMVKTHLPAPGAALESALVQPDSPWGQARGLTQEDVRRARRPPRADSVAEQDAQDPQAEADTPASKPTS